MLVRIVSRTSVTNGFSCVWKYCMVIGQRSCGFCCVWKSMGGPKVGNFFELMVTEGCHWGVALILSTDIHIQDRLD